MPKSLIVVLLASPRGMACVQVMQTLKGLAEEGCTVVCSIHQPRSSIFAMFDDLLILSEGKLLYEGSADGSLKFFEAQVPHSSKFSCVSATLL